MGSIEKATHLLQEEAEQLKQQRVTFSFLREVQDYLNQRGVDLDVRQTTNLGAIGFAISPLALNRKRYLIIFREDPYFPLSVRSKPAELTLMERIVIAHEYAHILLMKGDLKVASPPLATGPFPSQEVEKVRRIFNEVERLCDAFAAALLGLSMEEIADVDRKYNREDPIQTRFL